MITKREIENWLTDELFDGEEYYKFYRAKYYYSHDEFEKHAQYLRDDVLKENFKWQFQSELETEPFPTKLFNEAFEEKKEEADKVSKNLEKVFNAIRMTIRQEKDKHVQNLTEYVMRYIFED